MTQPANPRTTAVCIALGSNIEPRRHIENGLRKLKEFAVIKALSTIYRSPALGHPEQPDYLNGVVAIETLLDARTLKFDVLRKIEEAEGRVRTGGRYAARTLDMDILLYGNEIIEAEGLAIPDPAIRERAFLLQPLLEVTPPGLCWPGGAQTLAALPLPADAPTLRPDHDFSTHLQKRILV